MDPSRETDQATAPNVLMSSSSSRIDNETLASGQSVLMQQLPLSSVTSQPSRPAINQTMSHTATVDKWASERSMLNACLIFQTSFKDFVQANEIDSKTETLHSIAERLIKKLPQSADISADFVEFVQGTRGPLQYLLKREQNLTDFIRPVKQLLSKKYRQIPRVSLRLFVDMLLSNSDSFLRSKLMRLLSKRNPVPMLQPTLEEPGSMRFVPELIHVWDYSQPTLLSFSIGACQGKSSLLNALFLTNFELSTASSYFDGTIDVDFGYHFLLPRRCINIADVHGRITEQTLSAYAPMFNGFLIHIRNSFLSDNQNISTIKGYLNTLPQGCYKMIIVRDVGEDDIDDNNDLSNTYTQHFPFVTMHFLPQIADKTTDENMQCIDELRGKICQSAQQHTEKIESTEMHLRAEIKKHLKLDELANLIRMEEFTSNIRSSLLSATKKDYPVYSLFTRICHYRKRRNKLNFYGNEESAAPTDGPYSVDNRPMSMFELQNTIINLENELQQMTECGAPFFFFLWAFADAHVRLHNFEMLSIELKRERDHVLNARELCMDLQFERCLATEVHWRNAIVCQERQPSDVQKLLIDCYGEFVENGMPFEIIDGDNFHFQVDFLEKSLIKFHDKRIFILSIIGPQNSGKSTLLNFMFGTLFDVRDGRCTRGVYGSLVKWSSLDFDYILLIDTEGLMSVEKKDPEYDRRLILFCLAVSHLVIVNTIGTFTADLQRLLQICADSLKHLQVNKVTGPIVHVILNQKSDPNLANHEEAIATVEAAMKETHLDEWINISRKTFHTLPSAFDQKHIIPVSATKEYASIDGIAVDTKRTFLDNVEQLREKLLICPTNSIVEHCQQISDLPRWIKFAAANVFDILQQFPDLTLFNDVHERKQDTQMQEETRKAITGMFTVDYQKQIQDQVAGLNEQETKDFYRTTFEQHLAALEGNLKNLLKFCGATEGGWVEKRSGRFLLSQLDGIRDAWCASALNSKERDEMKSLVLHGAAFLRKLIETAADEGVLTVNEATSKFDVMWDKETSKISAGFKHDEQLRKSFKFIYRNYHIFEKENLPEPAFIIDFLHILENVSANNVFDIIKDACVRYAFQHPPIQEHTFKIDTSAKYTFRTIEQFRFWYIPTLQDAYHKFFRKKSGLMKSMAHMIGYGQGHEYEHPWEPKLHEYLRKAIIKKYSINDTQNSSYGVWKEVLNLDYCFNRLIEVVRTKLMLENDLRRPINIEVVREIINELHDLSTEINRELDVFKFSLSKQLYSMFHICAVLILTNFFYDEERSHFNNVLQPVLKERDELLAYFLRMVVPNHANDELFARGLVNGLLETLENFVKKEAQKIITKQLQHDQRTLTREALLQQLELQARSSSPEWLARFILKPAAVLEETFQDNWKDSEREINRQIADSKHQLKMILIEFFTRLRTMKDRLETKRAHLPTYITDIFKASSGGANQNLTHMGKCLAELMFHYFAKNSIPLTFSVSREASAVRYELQEDGKSTFEEMIPPSDQLAHVVTATKSKFDMISIMNIMVFINHALSLQAETEKLFDEIPCTFAALDKTSKPEQHFKACGCGQKCPCCGRLCDFDHAVNTGAVSNVENRHRCARGHQLRAMGGYKRLHDNQASLLYCEQVADSEWIIVGSERMRWVDFKKKHSNWDWPIAPLTSKPRHPPPSQVNLFGYIWINAGELLCQQFNNGMIYVTHQMEPPIGNHYILVLDRSGSMTSCGSGTLSQIFRAFKMSSYPQRATPTTTTDDSSATPWKTLLEALKEFLRVRIEKGMPDLVTTILFADRTVTPFLVHDLSLINVHDDIGHTATCPEKTNSKCTCQIITRINDTDVGNSTNFTEAFFSVKRALDHVRNNEILTQYAQVIIFMTDGGSSYPEEPLQVLSTEYGSLISHFLIMGLGSYDKNMLERIKTKMNGELVDVRTIDDLVQAYAEVAHTT